MTICVHFMSPLASNVNLNTTSTKVKCALPYPIYHLKGSNSHTKPGVFQLGMSFNRGGRVAQSCNQSQCLYTHTVAAYQIRGSTHSFRELVQTEQKKNQGILFSLRILQPKLFPAYDKNFNVWKILTSGSFVTL